MKYILQLSYVVLLGLLASCSDANQPKNGQIKISLDKDMDKEVKMSSLFPNVNVVNLHEDPNKPMGEIAEMKNDESFYYCLDYQKTSISVFDRQGENVGQVNSVGHGANEYITIADFDTDKGLLYVLCLPSKILVFNDRLELANTIRLNETYSRICVSDEKIYVYSDQRQCISLVNHDNGTTKDIYTSTLYPYMPKSEIPVFHKTRYHLLFANEAGNEVLKIEGTNVAQLFEIDYTDKDMVLDRYANPPVIQGKEEHEKYSSPQIYAIQETDSCYIMVYSYAWLYRICNISKITHKILTDGCLMNVGPIPNSQNMGHLYGFRYSDPFRPLFIPNDEIDKLNVVETVGSVPEMGGWSIVEYLPQ